MSSRKQERRKATPRVLARVMVDYTSAGTYLYGYSHDLSAGGIYIETERPLATGSRLALRFSLPDLERVFQVQGEVAWANEPPALPKGGRPGMGVAFLDLSEEDQKQLQHCIAAWKDSATAED